MCCKRIYFRGYNLSNTLLKLYPLQKFETSNKGVKNEGILDNVYICVLSNKILRSYFVF